MNIDFFRFDGVHPLGDSAMHPIEPLATRLGGLLLLVGSSPRRCRACGAQPCLQVGLLQSVQTCAGTFGTKAFALLSRAASGPLGRVQLRNPG